jgi:hypothetical protein
MATLTTAQYDALERAIADGRRLAVRRRGKGEVVVMPRALRLVAGRERIDATHPTTGDRLDLYVEDIEGFEVVR